MRTYGELVDAAILALPQRAELDALTDYQIENLRKCGTNFDNYLYLELLRRREAAQARTDS